MLVIHGDKDYRVPIGEGLRLWYELLSKSGLPADEEGRSPHRFLYFPDENHWILTPQNAKVWYSVVEAFLAEHVLGAEPGDLPPTIGRWGRARATAGRSVCRGPPPPIHPARGHVRSCGPPRRHVPDVHPVAGRGLGVRGTGARGRG